jgi:uncharacterized protein YdaU (DUF1376 family)
MSKTDIWMPLYIGDHLGRTMHLSTCDHGAYVLLQIHYWMHGPIQDDDVRLARIARLSSNDWVIAKTSLSCLFRIEDGFWYDDYLEPLKIRQRALAARASAGAQAANRVRWGAPSLPDDQATPQATTERPPSDPLATPERPLHDPKLKSKSKLNTKLKSEEDLPPLPDGKGSSPELMFGDDPTPPAEPPAKPPAPVRNLDENAQQVRAVKEVFGYYLSIMRRNAATYTLTNLRKHKGLARLADALQISGGDLPGAIELMKAVVDQVASSAFHMGSDPKSAGHRYCEWENNLFRSSEQFQKWLQAYQDAAAKEEKRHA